MATRPVMLACCRLSLIAKLQQLTASCQSPTIEMVRPTSRSTPPYVRTLHQRPAAAAEIHSDSPGSTTAAVSLLAPASCLYARMHAQPAADAAADADASPRCS